MEVQAPPGFRGSETTLNPRGPMGLRDNRDIFVSRDSLPRVHATSKPTCPANQSAGTTSAS
jgi:hypothetical protein